MWDIYKSISNPKRTVACGDDQQYVEASRAPCSLQKLLSHGSRKMRKLERERFKAQEQRKAEKEHQDKRASRLKQEKRYVHSTRLESDTGPVKGDHGDDFRIQVYRRSLGTAYEQEHQIPMGTMAGLLDAVLSGGSGMTGTAEAGSTAAGVIASGDTL